MNAGNAVEEEVVEAAAEGAGNGSVEADAMEEGVEGGIEMEDIASTAVENSDVQDCANNIINDYKEGMQSLGKLTNAEMKGIIIKRLGVLTFDGELDETKASEKVGQVLDKLYEAGAEVFRPFVLTPESIENAFMKIYYPQKFELVASYLRDMIDDPFDSKFNPI